MLYSFPKRDLLLHLASVGLYVPKWTALIHDEWTRNLLRKRPDLMRTQLEHTIANMRGAFPDADVVDFEELICSMNLPDVDDRHVLAAAVRCHADVIVTDNIKDFPAGPLKFYNLEVQTPDAFASMLIDLHPQQYQVAFRKLASMLKNPPRTNEEILENFRTRQAMPITADKLVNLQ